MMSFSKDFLNTTISRLKYYKDLGERSFEQLEEKDFHFKPSSESNSIAIIIQHIAGNMLSRFTNFLTEDGEKDWRRRDDEFEAHNYTKQQLIDLWEKGWRCCLSSLESLKEEDLIKIVFIRKEPLSVVDAINRQLAHYAYHIGQILYVARIIKNEEWKNLSIPKKQSTQYNSGTGIKDPAKKF